MERVFLDVFLNPTAGNQLILKTAREKDGCGQVDRHCAQECVHHSSKQFEISTRQRRRCLLCCVLDRAPTKGKGDMAAGAVFH